VEILLKWDGSKESGGKMDLRIDVGSLDLQYDSLSALSLQTPVAGEAAAVTSTGYLTRPSIPVISLYVAQSDGHELFHVSI
jgi:hypothetical protein